MPHYASYIDRFGLVADYLYSPRSRIDFLLHLKSPDRLVPLAEALHLQRDVDTPPWMFPEPIERGLREGSLLISSRHALSLSAPKQIVDVRTVPRDALCHTIHAPPFYLVHTPGLFEGTLVRASVEQNLSESLLQKRARRMKI